MQPDDPFDLQRFKAAQDRIFDAALAELQAGRKRSHWMWFIFPQLRGLGHSSTAQFYGLVSLDEARAYLDDPVLGPRLILCTTAAAECNAPSLRVLFGSPDDMKFQSSMSIFALAAPKADSVFRKALSRWCEGRMDERTVALVT